MAVFSGGGAGVEVLIGSLKLNSLLVSMLRIYINLKNICCEIMIANCILL